MAQALFWGMNKISPSGFVTAASNSLVSFGFPFHVPNFSPQVLGGPVNFGSQSLPFWWGRETRNRIWRGRLPRSVGEPRNCRRCRSEGFLNGQHQTWYFWWGKSGGSLSLPRVLGVRIPCLRLFQREGGFSPFWAEGSISNVASSLGWQKE